jgi:ornithine decarboxylase
MDKARFVLSRSGVLEKYEFLKGICPSISYSTKTNPEVGRVLEEETSCFFSIHTPEGLAWVRDPGRVWFLAESLDSSMASELLERGIENFVINNEHDLDTLLRATARKRARVNLLLRMRFQETTVYKGRYFLFGMTAGDINRLVPELRKNRNIRRLGIHFHRKSQNTGNWSLRYMLEEMLAGKTLEAIDMVNIGGGIPVAYKNTNDSNLGYIIEKIVEVREWLGSMGIEMIIEPGRPISAPAVRLEASIISVSGRSITVNCSVYNSSMDTIIVPHKLLVEGEGEGESYVIKGCTPCSMDIFRYDVRLKNPRVGDRLVFLNAGAYNFASSFCNLERPETVVVD